MSSANNNLIAVAVVLPADVKNVRLVAGTDTTQGVVSFSDDGAFSFDMQGDGEQWAVLQPSGPSTTIRIAGQIANVPVTHSESVEVPGAWRDRTYPVTLRAELVNGEWTLERTLGAPLPSWDGPTGAGLAGRGEQVGLSSATLYLGWGALVLALGITAVMRGAILRARRA